jgi:hypothetical protein
LLLLPKSLLRVRSGPCVHPANKKQNTKKKLKFKNGGGLVRPRPPKKTKKIKLKKTPHGENTNNIT